jgi:hypothetical protein
VNNLFKSCLQKGYLWTGIDSPEKKRQEADMMSNGNEQTESAFHPIKQGSQEGYASYPHS